MAGRKGKYESNVEPHIAEIPEWRKNLTEAEIAEKLGISVSALSKYKNEHEELKKALKLGAEQLAKDLKNSLIKRGKGFYYTESKKITCVVDGKEQTREENYKRYSPPDVSAINLLLKNIDPEWRNDDMETIKIKREKIEIEKQKSENSDWK